MDKVLVQTEDGRMNLLPLQNAIITEWGANTTKFTYGNNLVVIVMGSFEQIANMITNGGTNEQISKIKQYRREQ